MALNELKTEVLEVFNIEVSAQTVTRSLQQEGYHGMLWRETSKTMKTSKCSSILIFSQSNLYLPMKAISTSSLCEGPMCGHCMGNVPASMSSSFVEPNTLCSQLYPSMGFFTLRSLRVQSPATFSNNFVAFTTNACLT